MQLFAIGAILLATCFWGLTFSFIKIGLTDLSPYNFLFWRFLTAAGILSLIKYKKFKRQWRKSIKEGVLLGFFLGGTVFFQTIGLKTTKASTASFITGISVILVPIFITIVNRTRPSLKIIIASIAALIGIGMISLQSSSLSISTGSLWVLLCAVCFAIYIILAGIYSRGHSPMVLSNIQCIVIFLIAGVLSIITGTFHVPDHVNAWTAILFCAVFASIFALMLQLHFQKYLSSTTTAIIFACEPIFATIAAVLILGEHLTDRFYFGAALIFIAIFLSEMKLKKKTIPQD